MLSCCDKTLEAEDLLNQPLYGNNLTLVVGIDSNFKILLKNTGECYSPASVHGPGKSRSVPAVKDEANYRDARRQQIVAGAMPGGRSIKSTMAGA